MLKYKNIQGIVISEACKSTFIWVLNTKEIFYPKYQHSIETLEPACNVDEYHQKNPIGSRFDLIPITVNTPNVTYCHDDRCGVVNKLIENDGVKIFTHTLIRKKCFGAGNQD